MDPRHGLRGQLGAAHELAGAFGGGRLLLLDAEGVDRTPGFLP